jgi:hypothetical protein
MLNFFITPFQQKVEQQKIYEINLKSLSLYEVYLFITKADRTLQGETYI